MPFKLTPETFVRVLWQSGLVAADRVPSLLLELSKEGIDVGEPLAIADALVRNGTLTQWQAENLLKGKHRGFDLGKYRLLSLLGRGATGPVYLAEHALMQRRCAIKVLPTLGSPAKLARFHREARAAASLDHTNIVRAYDVEKAMDGATEVQLLVMEFVEGESLEQRVTTEGPLAPVEAADYMRQAAEGLAHAHRCGIVHRDIKPANLLVDSYRVVKILRTGLTAGFDGSRPAADTGGSRDADAVDFLAPEQALDSRVIDARSDLYALGCVFYFLLAGHPPFPDGTLTQRLLRHKKEPPVPITELRPDVLPDLAAIIGRMMAKRPEDRFQTAGELSEALRDWLVRHADADWIRNHPGLLGGCETRSKAGSDQVTNFNAPSPPGAPAISGCALQNSLGGSPSRSSTRCSLGNALAPTIDSSHSTTVEMETMKPAFAARGRSRAGEPLMMRRLASRTSAPAWKKPIILLTPIGLTSVIAVVAALAWFSPSRNPLVVESHETPQTRQATAPPSVVGPPVRRSILRDVSVWPSGQFKTIGEAIAYVHETSSADLSPWDTRTIRVAGRNTYRERIVIANSDDHFPKRLRMICEDSHRAILSPTGPGPVIQINGVENFSLEGFEIDAAGKQPAIELGGYVIGTHLSNLEIVGIRDTGIRIRGAVAFDRPGTRCVLDGLVFRSTATTANGVCFDASGPTSNLTLDGCRFFGPFADAVQFIGPTAGIEIRNSIFTQSAVGVLFDGKSLTFKDVAIVGNTFHRLDRGIAFQQMPQRRCNGLLVQRNIFSQLTGPEMTVGPRFDRRSFLVTFGSGGTSGNWTSRALPKQDPDGEINLCKNGGKSGVTFRFESTDPTNPKFLQPLANAPHKSAGAIVVK